MKIYTLVEIDGNYVSQAKSFLQEFAAKIEYILKVNEYFETNFEDYETAKDFFDYRQSDYGLQIICTEVKNG